MDYKYKIKEFLIEFEKKFNLNLKDLNWVDQKLYEVYHYGYANGEKNRDD